MDEIVVEERPIMRFFCHKCGVEFDNVALQYTCPHCSEGFIEELENPVNSGFIDVNTELSNILGEIREIANFHTLMSEQRDLSSTTSGRNSRRLVGRRRYASQLRGQGLSRNSRRLAGRRNRMYASQLPGRRVGRSRIPRVDRNIRLPFENLFTDILNLTGHWRRGSIAILDRGIVSPPFDYLINDVLNLNGENNRSFRGANRLLNVGNIIDLDIWGRNIFDNMSTQLLNQMDGSGPPPMPRDRIIEIPVVSVTSDQVKSKLQCSVCWEYFRVGELVRSLPCQHVYHDACIRPWLELHATCPICRMSLAQEVTEDIVNNPNLTSNEISSAVSQFEHFEQEQHQQITQNLDQLSQLIRQVQHVIQYAYP